MEWKIFMLHIADKNHNDRRFSTHIDYLNFDNQKCRAEYKDGKFTVWAPYTSSKPIIMDHLEYIEGELLRKWTCKYNETTHLFEHSAVDFHDTHTSDHIHYRHWHGDDFSCYFVSLPDELQSPAASKDEYELHANLIKVLDDHRNNTFSSE